MLPLKGQGVRAELLPNRNGLQELLIVSCAFGSRAATEAETFDRATRVTSREEEHQQ